MLSSLCNSLLTNALGSVVTTGPGDSFAGDSTSKFCSSSRILERVSFLETLLCLDLDLRSLTGMLEPWHSLQSYTCPDKSLVDVDPNALCNDLMVSQSCEPW